MSRLLLVVLVLLLPWRLWAADAMTLAVSTGAASAQAPCHQAAADLAVQPGALAGAAVDAPAVDMARAQGGDAAGSDGLAADPHVQCLLCGLCHLTLGAPATQGALPQGLPASPPVPVSASALEVEPQRVVEPPRG